MDKRRDKSISGQKGLQRAKQRRDKRGKIATKWSNAPVQKQIEVQQPLDQIDQKLKQCSFGGNNPPMNLKLMQRLNKASKNIIPITQGSMMQMGFNPSIVALLTDGSRIRRKITLPQDGHFNYTGLLIGPKGQNQKKLQQLTGCKILVRGKGSQKEGQGTQYQQEGELHVLIVGDNELQVARACTQVQRIIFSDQTQRNRLRQQQMKVHRQIKSNNEGDGNDLAMNTPFGTPSQQAFLIQVPNQCVGMVIGKDGLTVKMIQQKSGAKKVQVATSSSPGIETRNIFVQGDKQAIQRARKILEGIVSNQMATGITSKISSNFIMDMEVPTSLIGLVIGKNGQTIKGINGKTGAYVCLAKEDALNKERKILRITGPENLCYAARYQIDIIVQNGLKNLQKTNGYLTQDEMSMVKPVQTYPQQFEGVSFVTQNDIDPQNQNQHMLQQLSMMNPAMSQMLFNQISPNNGFIEEKILNKKYY